MFRKKIAYSVQRIAFSIIILAASYAYGEQEKTEPVLQPTTQSQQAAQVEPISQPPAQKDPIVVNGDVVEYFHEKKEVVGTGNVSITYKDVILTCDKITVHIDTREGIAEGNVKVRQNDAYFTGDKISYNFDTRKGDIVDGYISARPFFGRAESIDKAAIKDDFQVNRGYVTTCDLDNPHYRIQAKQVKVYAEDKIVAKNILFYIGNVPVMYLPYYVQSLKDRKTHISIIPGQDKDWGYYLLTAYRYYLADWSRGDILLDYRSKMGIGTGVNHYINTNQLGNGAFKFYYARQNDAFTFTPEVSNVVNRYRYQYRHRWDMGPDTGTYMIAELNKLSDKYIIKDIFYNEYEELGSTPDNYISFITTKPEYSTEFLVRARLNNFETVVERLPQYNINIYNYQIKNTNFYYTGTASGSYLNIKYDNTNAAPGQALKDVGAGRVDTYNQISYAAKLFKSLSTTPYAGMRETYYSRTIGRTNQFRTIFQAGVDNQIKFYKIYDYDTNFMGLDINKLRHIITPMANYYFINTPTIKPDNLNQFDEIDAFSATNGIRFGLENRLQTKRGTPGNMNSVDLATLMIWSDYVFKLDEASASLNKNKFKNLDFQLELIPYSWAYLTSKLSVDTNRYTIQSGSIDLVMNGGEKWQLIIGQRYENIPSGITSLITMDAMYRINKLWRLRAYERFNVYTGALEEQEYTIYRDLHCWVAEVIWNIKSAADQGLYLVMRLKAFPEYPVGYRRMVSRPRFGAAGETY